ncbi:hypothetical protein HDU84_003568 [Entophlyctis sp. JEL0112]|nr:hypothetical protein HDU84_003568 [Entophlyctis sp. JEL0112]
MDAKERLLREGIAADPLLAAANIDAHHIDYSFDSTGHDVDRTLALLRSFALWHQENLGDPAARVSIVHVHAYFLTKLFFSLPNLLSRDGRILVFRRMSADRIGGVPKQFAAYISMYGFYGVCQQWRGGSMCLFDVANFKVVNLRLNLYRTTNLVGVTLPAAVHTPLVFYNASPFFQACFHVIKQQASETNQFIFKKGPEIFELVDPSMLPSEYGGLITEEQLDNQIEAFIKSRYAEEGLKYVPIDIRAVDWKTYRVPGKVAFSRTESAVPASVIDYQAVESELMSLGYLNKKPEE